MYTKKMVSRKVQFIVAFIIGIALMMGGILVLITEGIENAINNLQLE